MSLCLSLSLSERGKRKKQRFLKIFSPVILEPLTTRKVTQFVASRFSLIFSLGGSRKKLKIATKALSWQHCVLMKEGRMKGQAFVGLPSERGAEKALRDIGLGIACNLTIDIYHDIEATIRYISIYVESK